ncbi:MAG: hypothetical protein RLZ14_2069 [Actinomycetota bacterium]
MVAGLVLAPSAAVAAPVDAVPAETVPVETVPVETVPVDSVPTDPAGLTEGCAQVDDIVMCVGPPPVPYESVDGPVMVATPEAVAAPSRAAVAPAAQVEAVRPAVAPPLVASEAPVPASAPTGVVTLRRPAARPVTDTASDLPAPVVPVAAESSGVLTLGISLVLGGLVVLVGGAGFRRARVRS